jgi:hypothetical protein
MRPFFDAMTWNYGQTKTRRPSSINSKSPCVWPMVRNLHAKAWWNLSIVASIRRPAPFTLTPRCRIPNACCCRIFSSQIPALKAK